MSDMTQVSNIINQFSLISENIAKNLTPYALGAAKLTAWSDLLNWVAVIVALIFCAGVSIFCLIKAISRIKTEKDLDDWRNGGFVALSLVFGIFALGLFASIVFNISSIFIDIYGINHPNMYIAYSVFEKISNIN